MEALANVSQEQWAELKLPMGVVNQIKKRLAELQGPSQQPMQGVTGTKK